jgi:hypothetical protein
MGTHLNQITKVSEQARERTHTHTHTHTHTQASIDRDTDKRHGHRLDLGIPTPMIPRPGTAVYEEDHWELVSGHT